MGTTVARLPTDVRDALREPLGAVYTDADALLADAGEPILAVGDVVTHHLEAAGHAPHVALVDGRTKREATTGAVAETVAALPRHVAVENGAGTLSAELLEALATAIEEPSRTVIDVDGEEDLGALPAVLLAPEGATVVYGQPGEGMVSVPVGGETRSRVRTLLERFDTEERFWALLE